MNESATATGNPSTPLVTSTAPNAVSDKDCDVFLVHGKELDKRRVCFEIALLSLNPESVTTETLALSTPSPKFSLGIQSVSKAENAKGAVIPHTLALTAGLIAHGYIPDDWLCALMTLATPETDLTYITTFDSRGIYGRSEFLVANLSDRIKSETPNLDILQKQLNRTLPHSVDTQRELEALYVNHERLHLDEKSSERTLANLSEALEILVEPLPAPSSDLISAGLRWLAAEVK